VKEPNISIYFYFPVHHSMVLFPMLCVLVEGECLFLPARHSKRDVCYGDVAGWLGGCLSVTASIVSKRQNLS